MEYKHFSHTHSLIPHQVPQGSQINCSGCKSPGTGAFYACWQCSFFLHHQCFHATRSMTHPSHPTHPLTLVPYPTYPSNSFFCNSCNLIGSSLSYSCSNCEFDLHVHCAYNPNSNLNYTNFQHETIPNHNPPVPVYPMHNYEVVNSKISTTGPTPTTEANHPPDISHTPNNQTVGKKPIKHFSHRHNLRLSEIKEENSIACSGCEEDILGTTYCCTKSNCEFYLHESCFKLAREIKHESHLEHPLTLLPSPAYKENGEYMCNACFNTSSCFSYHCKTCQFDLHVGCASLPTTGTRKDHEHPLALMYSSPFKKVEGGDDGMTFVCDVCNGVVDERCWVYYCKKCDFGTHLECLVAEKIKEGESLEGSVLAAQQNLQLLQLQVEMSRQNAELMARARQHMLDLI